MRLCRSAVFLIFALLAAAPLARVQAAAAPAADSVAVDKSGGYARILFTFQTPAPVTASVADGVLTIRLTRAVNTTIDRLTENLAAYVSSGRRDEDGLTYRFALSQPVGLHTSTQANRSVVDLVPDSYKGVPPDLPPPPPATVAKRDVPDLSKLPAIRVRVGEFANFTRLVFDWPQAVTYEAYPGHGRVSLKFETLARPDFTMLEARKPAWVKSAGWRIEGTSTIVDFDTDAESAYHDFRDGTKIAIDIIAPKTDASAYAPPGASAAIPITRLPQAPPAPIVRGSDQAAVRAASSAIQALAAPEAAAPVAAAKPEMPTEDLPPTAELTRDGALLRFPAARGHAVAVFTRGSTIWVVLDGHPAFDVASVLSPIVSVLERADASQVAGAAVLRLVFKASLLAAVAESDSALTVTFAASGTTAPASIAFTRQGADGQPTLTASLPGATRAISLADPEAGDHFFAVPARPGKANLTLKRFVELMALPTAAGLAVVTFTDDLAVQVQDEIVTFSRPRGLALSAASGADAEPMVRMVTSKQGAAFIDFEQWGKAAGPNLYDAVHNLRAAVARLPESEGNGARLQLARYFLANQLAPEALGEIHVIESADPKLTGEPNILAMKGAAQYMMGRYDDAKASLSGGGLGSDPHAALWRGMAEAKLGDYTNARRDLAQSQSVLRYYPQIWQTRARLARAETGLAQSDLASANDALDQLSPEPGTREAVEARLYGAQLLAAQGHVNEAISRLTALEAADYTPIAVRASYARIEAQIMSKKLAPKEAIETLERLRYRWRGDNLELKVLRKLGSLYFADNNWRDGLGILRVAALNFPAAELGREAQDDMRRAFSDLFLGDKANSLQPVQALALFYEFIELTPIGRDGDELIRRLADRLVAIDLLGPAEQLLEHQVKERLEGVARASVATKLAMIYLLDRKFKEALATINESRQTRLPDDINAERRLLEARALAGLKQYEAGIDLIADDETRGAAKLRADIFWEAGNWKVAGDRIEELLGNRWNVSGPLTPEERSDAMRAAVAYSLSNDQESLNRLRERYGEKMSTSPDAKAFSVVSEPIERQGVAFRDLAKSIASVDTLQSFMTEFKKNAGPAPAKTASN